MCVWWVLWIHNASSSRTATIALAQKHLIPTLPILVINLFRVDRKSASLWFVFKVLLFHPWGFHSNLDNLFKWEPPGLSCLHLSSAEILQISSPLDTLGSDWWWLTMTALALPKESPTHQGDRCVLSPLLSCLIYLLLLCSVQYSFMELLPAPLKLAGPWLLMLGKHLLRELGGLVLSKESRECIEEF